MLSGFFYAIRDGGLKVSITEYLMLLEAMEKQVAVLSIDDFYYLSRTALVKDETKYDKFDKLFGNYFKGIEEVTEELFGDIPDEWLRKQAEPMLSEEEMKKIEAMGGFDELMETLKKRLEEQKERHEGGNKWIGTGGTSPFGAYGFNPSGVRIGQKEGRQGRATKVWDKREYANLDDSKELGTRNIKIALRRLRRFAREGAADVLDIDDTIGSTAKNAGYLDIKMVPERHNAVKVLLLLDIGGSMDGHVRLCEELFSATKTEFKHLEYFYFHNFIYESVWKDNKRRHSEKTSTFDLMHKYPADYKVIFVGDATMSPYEIMYAGGSVEHWNEEAGETWMRRMVQTYPNLVWLNPEPESRWDFTPSVEMTRKLVDDRMFPLTIEGLDRAMRKLT